MGKKKIELKIDQKEIGAEMYYSNYEKNWKPDLHTIPKKKYQKALKKAKEIAKNKKMKYKKKLLVIGAWLHAIQDKWAHGLIEDKFYHTKKTDKVNWTDDYHYDRLKKTKKKVGEKYVMNFKKYNNVNKMITKNKRLKGTISDTIKYLSKVKKVLTGKKVDKAKINNEIKKYFS